MALPKAQHERVNNEIFLTEEQAVGLLEKEWKNIVFLSILVILGFWLYSEYKETINQREGEASAQFTSLASDVSSLIDESLKGEASKELLEKEDRIIDNLSRLKNLDDGSYASFALVMKTALMVFKGKEISSEDLTKLDQKISTYKSSRDTLILSEMLSLLKCRFLLESGQTEKGILDTKALLRESKVIFPEVASVLMIFSPENNREENKNLIVELLKLKPEQEDQTRLALQELGYTL